MVSFKKKDELEYLEVYNQSARAKIALQGAHIFFYQAQGKKPLLWLSETSHFKKGKAIRGGIPICWPWFGVHESDSNLPKHGFARTFLWEHIKTEELNGHKTEVSLRLKSSPETLKLWLFSFELILVVTVGEDLEVRLTTKNCDTKPLTITQALHSYFEVSDIHKVFVEGLDQKHYYNKVDESFDNVQTGKLFITQETDRVYQAVTEPVALHDEGDVIKLTAQGTRSVVVWNPWSELTAKMSDLSDYHKMLCIENANALDDRCTLEAGTSASISVLIQQMVEADV